jgi:hypothetical protein
MKTPNSYENMNNLAKYGDFLTDTGEMSVAVEMSTVEISTVELSGIVEMSAYFRNVHWRNVHCRIVHCRNVLEPSWRRNQLCSPE